MVLKEDGTVLFTFTIWTLLVRNKLINQIGIQYRRAIFYSMRINDMNHIGNHTSYIMIWIEFTFVAMTGYWGKILLEIPWCLEKRAIALKSNV